MTTIPTLDRIRICVICGHESNADVGRRLTWFDPPLQAGPVHNAERCWDEAACRARLAAIPDGGPWPLGRPGSRPMPPVEPPADAVELGEGGLGSSGSTASQDRPGSHVFTPSVRQPESSGAEEEIPWLAR